tara:strand:- start:571 stop:693 length:123 start_codon:yes stop_codon:yes gene_type:complete
VLIACWLGVFAGFALAETSHNETYFTKIRQKKKNFNTYVI